MLSVLAAQLGGPELLIILAIVLLLFGARKLPELSRSVGKSVREFRKGIDETDAAASESETADRTE